MLNGISVGWLCGEMHIRYFFCLLKLNQDAVLQIVFACNGLRLEIGEEL